MVFSTNQSRQLYVVSGVADAFSGIQGTELGKIFVGGDKDGCKFINQNGYGGIVRSDLIDPKSVIWANLTSPKDTEIKLKAYALGLQSTVNSGKPIVGEDYIVRVNFRQYYGMSDEDIYQKYGAVHATSAHADNTNGVGLFMQEMAYSLFKNFSRLYSPSLYIGLASATKFALIKNIKKNTNGTFTITYYPKANFNVSGYSADADVATDLTSATITKLIIAERSQVDEWALGTKQYTPVYFDVIPTTVNNGTSGEVEWGTVTDYTSTYNQAVGNGYKYADLEYFCMGERADQYRNIGWPKSIPTKYFVVPTNTYYALDIQYAYQGDNHAIQKSEKTLTLLFPSNIGKDTIDSVIEKLGIAGIVNQSSKIPSISFEKAEYSVAKSGTVTVKANAANSTGTITYSINAGTATGTTISNNVVTASTTAGKATVTATLTEDGTAVDTATCIINVG